MAGILFTNGKLVLAGYNQHKLCITGIGGKKKNDEMPHQTALREMLEELFELDVIPEALTKSLSIMLPFDKLIIATKKYTVFIMSFDNLNTVFRVLHWFGYVKSRVYETIPTSVSELLFNRTIHTRAEFSMLALVPCHYNLSLDSHFINDIYAFKNCESYLT